MNKHDQTEIDSLRQELHDGVGATLSQITMLAYYGRLQEENDETTATFSQIAELANKALSTMRQKISDLENVAVCLAEDNFNPLIQSQDSVKTAPLSLLLVEDNFQLAETLMAILQKSPAISNVEKTASAEEALTFLQSLSPDILLVDIGLPGMGGVELIEIVSSTFPAIVIMVYTSYEDNPTVFAALKAGASGYIIKETPPEQLIESLIVLKNGGAPMTPRIANKVLHEFQHSVHTSKQILSDREEAIVKLIEQSLSYNQVAERLGISSHTVHTHIKNIYRKLLATNRSDVLKKAREIGVI